MPGDTQAATATPTAKPACPVVPRQPGRLPSILLISFVVVRFFREWWTGNWLSIPWKLTAGRLVLGLVALVAGVRHLIKALKTDGVKGAASDSEDAGKKKA